MDLYVPSPPFDNMYSYCDCDCLEVKRNIIRTVLYWQHATSSMDTVDKKQFIQPGWALIFFMFFRLHDLSLCWCIVLFYVGQLRHVLALT